MDIITFAIILAITVIAILSVIYTLLRISDTKKKKSKYPFIFDERYSFDPYVELENFEEQGKGE